MFQVVGSSCIEIEQKSKRIFLASPAIFQLFGVVMFSILHLKAVNNE